MMKIFALLFTIALSNLCYGQTGFYKMYSGNGYDYGQGIVETPNKDLLVTGSSSSFFDAPSQTFLMRIDSLGNFLWSRDYGGPESDWGRRVLYIDNEAIFIAGYSNSFSQGDYDFNLIRTDLDGNQIWNKTYGSSSWEKVNDAALTRDSGVFMVGETLNTLDGASDIMLVRTDKNGVELWSQQIGGAGEDFASDIIALNDSIFLVSGTTYSQDSLVNKGLLFKVHEDGTIIWYDTIGNLGEYYINDVALTSTTLNIVGRRIDPNLDTANFQTKLNLDGSFILEFSDAFSGTDFNTGIIPFGFTDRFLVSSTMGAPNAYGGLDVAFGQFFGALYWELGVAAVNYVGLEELGELAIIMGSGGVGVGFVEDVGIGGSNVFVIKMYPDEPFFNSNDDFTTTPLVGLLNKEFNQKIEMYPNPASKEVIFELSNVNESVKGVVVDQQGRVVKQFESNQVESLTISVSDLASGIYTVQINTNETVYSSKLQVIH